MLNDLLSDLCKKCIYKIVKDLKNAEYLNVE